MTERAARSRPFIDDLVAMDEALGPFAGSLLLSPRAGGSHER
jgi:hypothetical protein